MATPNTVPGSVAVSVIIPARNEEACLGACLASLVAQTEVSREIIVVDDSSTDRTREVARSFPEVRLVCAAPPPPQWTGKNNAIAAGVRVARGEWLLFTDADTFHRPGSLARAVAEARERCVDMLSYSPEQELRGFWERAVMPVIFAELTATYRPSQVSDPLSPAAAANGQYILISRQAYDAVGGHAAVAADLLEDVALARAVKSSGRRILFRYGGDAVRTRMYRSFSQLRDGWTKNLALLFLSPSRLALLRITEFALILASLAGAIVSAERSARTLALASAALALGMYALLLRRIQRAHSSWTANALSLFGLPVFSYLLLRSRLALEKGSVSWKGRTYGAAHKPGEARTEGPATATQVCPPHSPRLPEQKTARTG